MFHPQSPRTVAQKTNETPAAQTVAQSTLVAIHAHMQALRSGYANMVVLVTEMSEFAALETFGQLVKHAHRGQPALANRAENAARQALHALRKAHQHVTDSKQFNDSALWPTHIAGDPHAQSDFFKQYQTVLTGFAFRPALTRLYHLVQALPSTICSPLTSAADAFKHPVPTAVTKHAHMIARAAVLKQLNRLEQAIDRALTARSAKFWGRDMALMTQPTAVRVPYTKSEQSAFVKRHFADAEQGADCQVPRARM